MATGKYRIAFGGSAARETGSETVSALREISPGAGFDDIDTGNNGREVVPDTGYYLDLIERGELDIFLCDASLLPLSLNPGLRIAAVLERTNPFHVFISRSVSIFEDYEGNMPIEVSNPVVKGQLIYHHPAYSYVDCETDFRRCYRRMENEKSGGFVLPAFVVETLNRQSMVVEVFNSSVCMPPPGQGALAMVTDNSNKGAIRLARKIDNSNVHTAINLERKFAEKAGIGSLCVGALCSIAGTDLHFSAVLVKADGSEKAEHSVSGSAEEGDRIINKLIDRIQSSGIGTGTALV